MVCRPSSFLPIFAALRLFGMVLTITGVLSLLTPAPALSQRVAGKEVVQTYQTAQELLEEGKTREALRVIRKQLRSDDLTPDERAVLRRFADQLEADINGDGSADIDIEVLSPDEQAFTKSENYFFLGRLYLVTEPPDYDKAIENLRKSIETAEVPDPDAYFHLAQAQAKKGKCRMAIPHAEEAIELAKTPRERHHRLLLHCHVELGHHEKVIALAKGLIERFGARDAYLKPLAEAYQAVGRERDAFLTHAQRYELGFLKTEAELVGIAELYRTYGNPHRAARILDKEMKAGRVRRTEENLEKLGNMWFLAREYDEARANLKAAARMKSGADRKPKTDAQLAYECYQDQDWDCAETRLRRALRKGKLNEPCWTRVLLAWTLMNKDKKAESIKELKRAARTQACAEVANLWAEYLGQKERIERELRKGDHRTEATEKDIREHGIP